MEDWLPALCDVIRGADIAEGASVCTDMSAYRGALALPTALMGLQEFFFFAGSSKQRANLGFGQNDHPKSPSSL